MANEKWLIDANAFWKSVSTDYWEHFTQCHTTDQIDLMEMIKENLAEQPTVDAVELPCKIGDKVYRIDKGNYHSNLKPFVEELTVTEISWKKEKYGDKDLGFAIIANGIRYKFTSIGKSVFLTRKEAEAKMDGDGNG